MATVLKNGHPNGAFSCVPSSFSGPTPEFVLIPHGRMDTLLRVLETRLPRAANVYNCALRLSRHPGEFEMFALDGDLGPGAWILSKFNTQALGAGQLFGVSARDGGVPAPSHSLVRQAFIETRVIDWDSPFEFTGLDGAVGALITEISTMMKGNVITSHPNLYFTMEREEALALEVQAPPQGVRVAPLTEKEGAEFIVSQWKYAGAGTREYARAMIARHPSCGVYVEGAGAVPVSGVLTHAEILVGMLATSPEHQGRGFALLCMKTQLRALAREGYIPGSCVEIRNEASRRFHEKVGMRFSHGTVDLNTLGF